MNIINSFRDTITTKYLPTTNTKCERIKATCQRGSVTVSWDYSLNQFGNHAAAVTKLTDQFIAEDRDTYTTSDKYLKCESVSPWAADLVAGEIKGGFVFIDASIYAATAQ